MWIMQDEIRIWSKEIAHRGIPVEIRWISRFRKPLNPRMPRPRYPCIRSPETDHPNPNSS